MKKFFLFILVLGAIVGAYFVGVQVGKTTTLLAVEEKLKDDEDNKITTTGPVISNNGNLTISADNGDIDNVDFVYSSDYRSVTIRFVPKVKINNLQLQVKMSDSTGFLLDTQVITIGNVAKGQQYTTTVTLTNNQITAGKVIKTVEMNVYGGTLDD